jgi:hypothetical protein
MYVFTYIDIILIYIAFRSIPPWREGSILKEWSLESDEKNTVENAQERGHKMVRVKMWSVTFLPVLFTILTHSIAELEV